MVLFDVMGKTDKATLLANVPAHHVVPNMEHAFFARMVQVVAALVFWCTHVTNVALCTAWDTSAYQLDSQFKLKTPKTTFCKESSHQFLLQIEPFELL